MNYALITGASSGIGLEYAHQLAARGYPILVVSNQREANEQVAALLTETYRVDAIALYADLSLNEAPRQVYEFCKERKLQVDVLISNAGILHFGKLIHTPEENIQRILQIHCTAPIQLCRLFGAEMCERRQGYILLMASMAAWTPYPTMSLYGSTKTLLKNFGQSLWYELAPEGVHVTTVFPSAVDTSFYNIDSQARKGLKTLGLIISPQKLVRGALRALFKGKRRHFPDVWTRLEITLCQITPPWIFKLFLRLPVIQRILNRL